jgi:hypothetical protein
MKHGNWIGTSLALLGGAWLLLPTRGDAWVIIGSGLNTTQRDFRIYNNFTDASANNNVTPNANFPGALGAPMAIWKACVEWGSQLHGNGDGDPSQPFGLGSGGANFDAVYAGLANGVGSTDDNIMSELNGSSGGVLAFTELPSEDGWRIRYYSTWAWADGPDVGIGTGTVDIQGVTAHEYGHALCLGHTGVAGSTMLAALIGNGVAMRSIEADDIGGVQAIYGVASASKPRITGVSINGSTITITGQNFDPTSNEVWFAAPAPTLDTINNPLVVISNQASGAGGTQLIVGAPGGAGDGDVVVKVPGTPFNRLSNAWPADINPGPPCNTPSNTCVPSPNSFSPFGAGMNYSGTTSFAQNNMTLLCYDIPPLKLTIFYYGRTANGIYPFGNGTRCIDGPLFRLLPATSSDSLGLATRLIDLNNMPPGGSMTPGSTMHASAYYRDPAAGGAFFNTADVLSWIWCP